MITFIQCIVEIYKAVRAGVSWYTHMLNSWSLVEASGEMSTPCNGKIFAFGLPMSETQDMVWQRWLSSSLSRGVSALSSRKITWQKKRKPWWKLLSTSSVDKPAWASRPVLCLYLSLGWGHSLLLCYDNSTSFGSCNREMSPCSNRGIGS